MTGEKIRDMTGKKDRDKIRKETMARRQNRGRDE